MSFRCALPLRTSCEVNSKIDYHILWKYFHSDLSEQDQQELDVWLKSSSKHRAYFEKVKKKYSENELVQYNPDMEAAWKNINRSVNKKRNIRWQISVAAGLLVITGLALFFELNKSRQIQPGPVSEISFDPGISKATLVFENGSQVELEAQTDTVISNDEVLINNSNNVLNYQTKEKDQKITKKPKEVQYNTLIVPRGGEYDLVLTDGTTVKINSESILRYPVEFTGNSRNVELIGEAFFKVKSDAAKPFIIRTGKHLTKVYGTTFNIKSYPEENETCTTLIEGHVTNSVVGGAEHELIPGHQSVFSKDNEVFQTKKVNVNEYTSWSEGRFYFRNMSLEEMTKILARWYDIEFQFNNDEIRKIKFSGNLKRYENIQTILVKLSKTNEITFSAYENTIFLN